MSRAQRINFEAIQKLWRIRVYLADQYFAGNGQWPNRASLEAFRIINRAMAEVKPAERRAEKGKVGR